MNKHDAIEGLFEKHRQHEMRYLDATRPSGEMDTRAIMVFLFSFALVALCLSKNDQNTISAFGFAIQAGRVAISILIVTVLIYWWVELRLAWRLSVQRSEMIWEDIFEVSARIKKLHSEEAAEYQDLSEQALAKRRKLVVSFNARMDELLKRMRRLPLGKAFGSPEANEIDSEIEAVHKELEDRISGDSEIAMHDQWTDQILGGLEAKMHRMKQISERLRKCSQTQLLRTNLEYRIPTAFLLMSLGVFVIFLLRPEWLLFMNGR